MSRGRLGPVIRQLCRAEGRAAPSDGALLANFAGSQDEAAFAALVRRHGPMVQGVCRRVLRDVYAAQDAFQATFLLLARRAGTLADPERVGPWLYGVAYRTAARARAAAARRRVRERRAPAANAPGPVEELGRRDLCGVLDEELSRLPPRYRDPVVLCYLEGHTNAEAARQLGCSRGTVATRLARARERLKRRLTGRGIGLPAGLAAWLGFEGAGAASVAKGVAKTMLANKLGIVAVVLLTAGLVGGVGLAASQGEGDPAERSTAAARTARSAPRRAQAGPYETTNFVVTAPTAQAARRIGRAAERHRRTLARRWLGQELPAWGERCPVQVKLTAKGSGGASTFRFAGGKVASRSMVLEGSLEQILADLLPHEMTHVVLADWAGSPIPRWADEGAAILAESPPAQERQGRALRTVLAEGRAIPLRLLLGMRDYPKDVVALHTQGHSLAGYLVRLGGRRKFLAFVAQGERDGWPRAVRAHYGHASVEELERAWLAGRTSASGFKVGGDFMVLNSAEYQIPVMANDKVYLVGFVDSGTVPRIDNIETYRVSAGFGVRFVVPMLGPVPIALDFGFPIVPHATEQQVFNFWLGFMR
jgi:RNA polymerase sigma factor (sigma-70 family)